MQKPLILPMAPLSSPPHRQGLSIRGFWLLSLAVGVVQIVSCRPGASHAMTCPCGVATPQRPVLSCLLPPGRYSVLAAASQSIPWSASSSSKFPCRAETRPSAGPYVGSTPAISRHQEWLCFWFDRSSAWISGNP